MKEGSLEIQLALESSHPVPSCLSKAGCPWVLWFFLIYELSPLGYRCIFPPVPAAALYSTCQLQSPSSSLLCSIWRASPLSLSSVLCLLIPQNLRDSPRTVSDIHLLGSISTAFLLPHCPSSFTSTWELVRNARSWDSPGGGPMVRTPYFYCLCSILGWETKFPHSSTKKKKKMQIPGPHLKSTEVRTLGMGPSNLFQQQLSQWLMLPNI